jgi:ABC-type cobalamin/Fe3+-siderophores transport system ATPase subunit
LIFLKKGKLLYQGTVDEVLHPDVISQVYGVDARVREDAFSGCSQVSYRIMGSDSGNPG